MRNKLIILLAISVGFVSGYMFVWVKSYTTNTEQINQQALLESILVNSSVAISKENYACEGDRLKTVGAVVSSLLEFNNLHSRNILSYGCYKSVCAMSVTDCKPWKSSECSSRFLKFDLSATGAIESKSFSCFDIP